MGSKYTAEHNYSAICHRPSGPERVTLRAGDTVELDDDVAEWVNLDSPGCLKAAAKERATKKAPKDRQAKAASDRGV